MSVGRAERQNTERFPVLVSDGLAIAYSLE